LKAGHDGLIKDFLEVFLGERRALDVAQKSEAGGEFSGLLLADRRLAASPQLDQGAGVAAEVGLGADEDDGRAVLPLGRRFPDLVDPLFPDVVKAGGEDDAEAQQEDVSVGINQRPQVVEVVLSWSVAHLECDGDAVDVDHHVVGVDGGGHVLRGVAVGGVADNQTRFAHRPVTQKHALDLAAAAAVRLMLHVR